MDLTILVIDDQLGRDSRSQRILESTLVDFPARLQYCTGQVDVDGERVVAAQRGVEPDVVQVGRRGVRRQARRRGRVHRVAEAVERGQPPAQRGPGHQGDRADRQEQDDPDHWRSSTSASGPGRR